MISVNNVMKWIAWHKIIFPKVNEKQQIAKKDEECQEVIDAKTYKELMYEVIDVIVCYLGLMRFDFNIWGAEFLALIKDTMEYFNISEDTLRKKIERRFVKLSKRPKVKDVLVGYNNMKKVKLQKINNRVC